MKIDLPIFGQKTPYTCLPACVRIVLHNYNHKLSETSIAKACGVNRRGARFEHVIVALGAEHLPYAHSRLTHAVVVSGLEGDDVIFIDPAPGREMRLETLVFFKAWCARGRSELVIDPPN
jgi:ABC-type bacteriocin/lantibiotic exporter with double-glycine peptidase domain